MNAIDIPISAAHIEYSTRNLDEIQIILTDSSSRFSDVIKKLLISDNYRPKIEKFIVPASVASSHESTITYMYIHNRRKLLLYIFINSFLLLFLTAHMHRRDKPGDAEKTDQMPKDPVPLSTEADLTQEMPRIVDDSLQRVINDKFHARPSSKHGKTMIAVAQQLLATNLALFHILLLSSFSPVFSSSCDFSPAIFIHHVQSLRDNPDFIEGMLDFVLANVDFQLDLKLAKIFIQRFLTCFSAAFFQCQVQLMNKQQQMDIAVVSTNDKQVVHYICGYILHALRKRYMKAKIKKLDLLTLLEYLYAADNSESSYSEWTETLDRGGLKRPSVKFFQLVVQIECWVRELTNVENLNTNTLVDLKEKLSDYGLLRSSWDRMIQDDSVKKWIILDHVLALFVKVRGFAVTRLVRKQLQKKRKDAKIAAGSRKALRKELRNISN